MTDNRINKIRAKIEGLKGNLLKGACSSQVAMETHCKEEAYNEVLGILDSMQEEPKKCMYSKDNYSDEDRKILCEDCEEDCEFNKKEKPVTDIDFEQELYKYFGQVKDFTLGMRIAKRFYDMGKNSQEPVSDDLSEYINELSKQFPEVSFAKLSRIAVRVAKWQKENEYTCYEEVFEDGAK